MANRSLNALKHGLSSKQVLLPTESVEEFAELRNSYFETLKPSNPIEAELVETLAATRWRLRRLGTIEANLFNNYILENADLMADSLAETGGEGKIAWSFKRLAEGNALPLLVRYEGSLTRTYERTLKALHAMQLRKQQNETAPAPAEPLSTPAPPPSRPLPDLVRPISPSPDAPFHSENHREPANTGPLQHP